MKDKKKVKGISLIVLIITIVVVIILATVVILTLTGNNSIDNAKKASFINDVASFREKLEMYKTSEYTNSSGEYDPKVLFATPTELVYNRIFTRRKKYIYYNTRIRKNR